MPTEFDLNLAVVNDHLPMGFMIFWTKMYRLLLFLHRYKISVFVNFLVSSSPHACVHVLMDGILPDEDLLPSCLWVHLALPTINISNYDK